VSTKTKDGDTTLQFKCHDKNYLMMGLAIGNSHNSYQDIDCAIYCSMGNLAVYELGRYRGGFGKYKATDIMQVRRVNGVVKYYKNNIRFGPANCFNWNTAYRNRFAKAKINADISIYYQKAGSNGRDAISHATWFKPPSKKKECAPYKCSFSPKQYVGYYPGLNQYQSISLWKASPKGYGFLETAKLRRNAALQRGEVPPPPPPTHVKWTNLKCTKVLANGGIQKSSCTQSRWNGAATSTRKFTGNTVLQFRCYKSNYFMAGLAVGNSHSSYQDIDCAIYCSMGNLAVYERGRYRGGFGRYEATDLMQVEKVGTKVTYYQGGRKLRVCDNRLNGATIADISIYYSGRAAITTAMWATAVDASDANAGDEKCQGDPGMGDALTRYTGPGIVHQIKMAAGSRATLQVYRKSPNYNYVLILRTNAVSSAYCPGEFASCLVNNAEQWNSAGTRQKISPVSQYTNGGGDSIAYVAIQADRMVSTNDGYFLKYSVCKPGTGKFDKTKSWHGVNGAICPYAGKF